MNDIMLLSLLLVLLISSVSHAALIGTNPGVKCDTETAALLQRRCEHALGSFTCDDVPTCRAPEDTPCNSDTTSGMLMLMTTQGTKAVSSCESCFPASATVELESGEIRRMDHLKRGNSVRVGSNEFSEIIWFSHKLPTVLESFTRLETSESILYLTGNHYLYTKGHHLVAAHTIKKNDILISANGTLLTVLHVNSEEKLGLYNPHTLDGNIVVDGVLTSTYTTTVNPHVAHFLLSPLRVLHRYSWFTERLTEVMNAASSTALKYLPRGKDYFIHV